MWFMRPISTVSLSPASLNNRVPLAIRPSSKTEAIWGRAVRKKDSGPEKLSLPFLEDAGILWLEPKDSQHRCELRHIIQITVCREDNRPSLKIVLRPKCWWLLSTDAYLVLSKGVHENRPGFIPGQYSFHNISKRRALEHRQICGPKICTSRCESRGWFSRHCL